MGNSSVNIPGINGITGIPKVVGGVTSSAIAGSDYAAPTSAQTFINSRINPRAVSTASSATPTVTGDSTDFYALTALAAAAAFAAPTGTPVDGGKLMIRILDNGTARALTWNAIFRAGTDVALPSTTVAGKTMYLGFIYNALATKWDLIGLTGNI